MDTRKKRLLAFIISAVVVLIAVSILEPGYSEICTYYEHPEHKECGSYNAVTVLLWHIYKGLDAGSALITALATILIGIFTWTLWRSTDRGGEHFRVTERAYVKVSPVDPGIKWDGDIAGGYTIAWRIKNFGSTPARVTDVISNAIVAPKNMIFDEIPESVRHEFPKETRAFLVRDDEFYQHPHADIAASERNLVESGAERLIVYGYADYIDQFGIRHRAGFGRQYLPNATVLNLIFPDTGAFNYDRLRLPGEGIDWNET